MQKILSCVLIVLLVAIVGCKKDSSSNPINPNTPAGNLYGSGSISFTAGSLGNLSFSGSWAVTSSGNTGNSVVIGNTWHSSSNWDMVTLLLWTNGTGTDTVGITDNGFSFTFLKGGTSSTDISNEYTLTSGTCHVTSFSSTGMQGTFSGTAAKSDQSTVTITNGTFNVTFGTAGM